MKTLSSRDRDPKAIVRELREHYPQGLPGEREQLVTELMNRGSLEHSEAVNIAKELSEGGYAHHLAGNSSRWLFTSEAVSMTDLQTYFNDHYDSYVAEADEPRMAMLEFIGGHLNVDSNVAKEILDGLEQAGYTSLAYDEKSLRDRYLVAFPEAFRPVA